jgi:pilus assembly protein CpaB
MLPNVGRVTGIPDRRGRPDLLKSLRLNHLADLLHGLGWRRVVLARRVVAGLLVLAALVLAVSAPSAASGTTPVVVASRELAPGSTVATADVEVRGWPPELVPVGALTSVAQVDGRVLAGAASTGEVLTAMRLAGPELARKATGGHDAVSVPIRLADGDVAGLLVPGRLVDVVTVGERSDQPTVLAAGAVVLTVLPAEAKSTARGRLVLVAVPRATATKLAAAILNQEVTITLR